MAFQVGSACYDTALSAAQSMAAQSVPLATHPWLISVQAVGENVITYRYANVADGSVYLYQQAISLQPCNMLSTSDAIDVGWLIGGVWLSIYVITFLIRYFWSETQGASNASDT